MISLIICSKDPQLLEKLKTNINDTIGVPYEIISIDNRQGEYGICQAYNLGAQQSNFEYLCFLHEDIEIFTSNWGEILINFFRSDFKTALIGVAGSKIKLSFPSGWTSFDKTCDHYNVYHKSLQTNGKFSSYRNNPNNVVKSEVMVLDGLFLATRKLVWEKIKFDTDIKGFHFYDIDYSIRLVLSGYKAIVIYNLDICHFSNGKFDSDWVASAIHYHNNKKKIFKLLEKNQRVSFLKNYKFKIYWLRRLSMENIRFTKRIALVISYGFHFNFTYLFEVIRFIFGNVL